MNIRELLSKLFSFVSFNYNHNDSYISKGESGQSKERQKKKSKDTVLNFKLDIWDVISKYFNKDEKWGDHKKLDPTLLYIIFLLREGIGESFIVHNAYELKGHSEDSYHYKGMALDGHFTSLNFYETILDLETLIEFYNLENKIGLGIYPEWKNPGFHIDTRGVKARWAKIGGEYVSYDLGKQRAKDMSDVLNKIT